MLRSLKHFGFNCDELCVVYKGHVRPLLEYADVVWNSALTDQTNTLEKVKKRPCGIILGQSYISYDNALVECGIETFSERREEHCLKFGRELRNSSNAALLSCRTTRVRKSPIPYFRDLLNA